MPHPQLNNGKCSACGGSDLTLAEDEDLTMYSTVTYADGAWTKSDPREDHCPGSEPVRLFCTACGVYHEVPEELK